MFKRICKKIELRSTFFMDNLPRGAKCMMLAGSIVSVLYALAGAVMLLVLHFTGNGDPYVISVGYQIMESAAGTMLLSTLIAFAVQLSYRLKP